MPSAHIHHVAGVDGPTDQLVPDKHRSLHDHILVVQTAPVVGVVPQ